VRLLNRMLRRAFRRGPYDTKGKEDSNLGWKARKLHTFLGGRKKKERGIKSEDKEAVKHEQPWGRPGRSGDCPYPHIRRKNLFRRVRKEGGSEKRKNIWGFYKRKF